VKDEKDPGRPSSPRKTRYVVTSEVVVEVDNEHRLRAAALAKLNAVRATTPEGLEHMRARIESDTAVALDFLIDPASAILKADGVRVSGQGIRMRRCPDHDDDAGDDSREPSPENLEGSPVWFPGT
jgi:hypothetical protein